MASELKVNKISPESGTTLTLGDSGDTVNFGSGVLPNFENLTVTGDLTVDTNSLKVDSTNNRVGIGTASPSVALDVVGAITASGTITANSFSGDGSSLTGITSVGGSTGVDFNDNVKARFGTGNDLEIYHDGSHSYISDQGTGNLILQASNSFKVENSGGTETYIFATENGAVELKHDNSTKIATTSTGATVTGTLTADGVDLGDSEKIRLGASQDLEIFHDGSNSIIKDAGTGQLQLHADNFKIMNAAGDENIFFGAEDGTARLFHDNVTRFETTSSGVDVTGEVLADKAYIAEATLTDGATINWDMSTQSVAKVTLGGNRTLAAPSNSSTGQFCSINVIQDGTGSRTLTWNAVFEFKDDTAPTLTTTASKGDLFVFRYNGSKWLEVGRNLNISQS